jgi:aryl-alcohol dehydrogenase-like predicted oxidoreductase
VNRRTLGRTGLPVSEIGFGAWAVGGNAYGNSYGPTDDAESTRAIRRAFELGCNFFDTADVYGHGHSETLLGAALHDVRDQVFIATKVGGNFYDGDVHMDFTPGYLRVAVERSLERLRTDHIDLLQLHNPPINLISAMGTYEPLEEMKREGLIRFYGVSVHPPEEGVAAVQASMPDTVQIVYNLARREAEDTFLPTAQAANVGVIAREPLANGFLAGRYNARSTWERGDIRSRMPRPYVARLSALGQRVQELAEKSGMTAAQLALKFVLDRQEIACAIVGMKTVQQVEENLNSGA